MRENSIYVKDSQQRQVYWKPRGNQPLRPLTVETLNQWQYLSMQRILPPALRSAPTTINGPKATQVEHSPSTQGSKLELVFGSLLLLFGTGFGLWQWNASIVSGVPATAGTVILAALPVILGFQLLLAFLNFDIGNVPRRPIHSGF